MRKHIGKKKAAHKARKGHKGTHVIPAGLLGKSLHKHGGRKRSRRKKA